MQKQEGFSSWRKGKREFEVKTKRYYLVAIEMIFICLEMGRLGSGWSPCSFRYSLLSSCWRYLPNQRPSFSHLRSSLHALALLDAEDPHSPFYVVREGERRRGREIEMEETTIFDITKEKNLSIIME